MAIEREVAGMRCGEVLAELSDYFDGDLAAVRREQLEAHLRGCKVCERFGSQFTDAVRALRQGGQERPPGTAAVFERLRARLERG